MSEADKIFDVILACACGKETVKITPHVSASGRDMILSYELPEGWFFRPLPQKTQVACCSEACAPKTETPNGP